MNEADRLLSRLTPQLATELMAKLSQRVRKTDTTLELLHWAIRARSRAR